MATRSVVATDDFNRANSNSLGSNWSPSAESTSGGQTADIYSNTARNEGSSDNDTFWNADSFNNDQYSKVKISAINTGTDDYSGVIVRANASDYVIGQHIKWSGSHAIYWYNGGAYTAIGSVSQALAVNDVLILEVIGTQYELILNDLYILGGVNASAPSSGSAGMIVSGSNDNASAFDDWEGGDMVSAGTVVKDIIGGMGIIPFAR